MKHLLKNNDINCGQRIDNWLYRLRFYKTKIIKEGKVRINRYKIYKPSAKIKCGDIITLNYNKETLVLKVNGFTLRRLSYKSAQEYYKIL